MKTQKQRKLYAKRLRTLIEYRDYVRPKETDLHLPYSEKWPKAWNNESIQMADYFTCLIVEDLCDKTTRAVYSHLFVPKELQRKSNYWKIGEVFTFNDNNYTYVIQQREDWRRTALMFFAAMLEEMTDREAAKLIEIANIADKSLD